MMSSKPWEWEPWWVTAETWEGPGFWGYGAGRWRHRLFSLLDLSSDGCALNPMQNLFAPFELAALITAYEMGILRSHCLLHPAYLKRWRALRLRYQTSDGTGQTLQLGHLCTNHTSRT
ncbi:hypothetical protein BO78DRAFT_226128 [Aspergillus sclerotiicarbonarius CBS 121057]|uniref:Uncharacterized protein n=1 Tax=Aspergillus sclerotiicarbonarius (strain CBS 121057 / IBT 28362) TaxID=1448318 RepID=A0A319EEF9_ASPSB|nr:hypothetical protein BO78DRAFT_226128 [Aspergillus sclerotiicarbonarius CBS 121057]